MSVAAAIQRLEMKGFGTVELWRKGQCIHKSDFTNGITNVGKNTFLNVMFKADAQPQIGSWYIGLITNIGYSAVSIGDSMPVHNGWAEYTATPGPYRLTWTPDAASGQQIVNSTPVTVTLNAADTLQGIFITSDVAKSGIIGILWSTALFGTPIVCSVGDLLKLTYAVQL
jgi:hypothetical protein